MSARLFLTTADTVKFGARAIVNSAPSRDLTVRVWPSSFSTVPRMRVGVLSGAFWAMPGQASRPSNAPAKRCFDNIALPPEVYSHPALYPRRMLDSCHIVVTALG